MYRIFLFVVLGLYTGDTLSQSLYKDLIRNKITLTHKEGNSVFYVAEKKYNPKAKEQKAYYWYNGGKLNVTQGGYSGKLLHGPYNAFYANKNLAEQGNFRKGLKKGEWKTWNAEGKLNTVTHWEDGLPNGRFFEYDSIGGLKRSGRYVNGELHGRIKNYQGRDSVRVERYDAGKLSIKKERAKNPDSRLNRTKRYIGEQFNRLKPKKKVKEKK